jgi:outer membrane protein assembly factor BamC
VVPEVKDDLLLAGDFEVPRPTPLVTGAADQLVRIQKLGEERWALIAMAPGQVWPQVRSFISALGLQVGRVDPRGGLIETNWVTLEDQPLDSRFRFRIEQGVQRGDSELHVLQMNRSSQGDAWPAVSDDLQQEADMLQSVAQYIANSADTAPVSMIADQAIRASGKIALEEAPEGYTYIRLGLPFNRAWASLDLALRASNFEITDRNRSAGEYYVRYLGPQNEEEEGWFDWLFGEDEDPLSGENFLVTMQAQGDDAVIIRIRPQRPELEFGLREEQSLLTLLKGNIN